MTPLDPLLAPALVLLSQQCGCAQGAAAPAAWPAFAVVATEDKAPALKPTDARKAGADASRFIVNQGEKQ